MRYKCAYCGRLNRLVEIPLTFRQRRILKAVEQISRNMGRPAPSLAIAAEIGVSVATIKNELAHLEHMNEVSRPNGPCSGWAIAEVEERISIPA